MLCLAQDRSTKQCAAPRVRFLLNRPVVALLLGVICLSEARADSIPFIPLNEYVLTGALWNFTPYLIQTDTDAPESYTNLMEGVGFLGAYPNQDTPFTPR